MSDDEPETQSDQGGAPPIDPPQIELDTPPPGWPKVVGIISIAWGSLGLTCGAFGAIMAAVIMPMGAKAIMETTGASTPPPSMDPNPLMWALMISGLAVAALLLIAGIMTMSRSAAGRAMHIAYAFISIVQAAIGAFYQYSTFQDTVTWANDNVDDPAIAGSLTNPIGMYIALAFGVILGLGYPLFCIFWFGALGKKPEIGKPDYI